MNNTQAVVRINALFNNYLPSYDIIAAEGNLLFTVFNGLVSVEFLHNGTFRVTVDDNTALVINSAQVIQHIRKHINTPKINVAITMAQLEDNGRIWYTNELKAQFKDILMLLLRKGLDLDHALYIMEEAEDYGENVAIHKHGLV